MTAQWPPDTVLERNGLRLEPLSVAHEAGLRDAAADGALWNLHVTSVPEPEKTRAYIEQALKQREEGNRLAFVVIDVGRNVVLGSTSYHDIIELVKRVEIGYTWYRKSVQRSHVNTTCKLMLMQHAFDVLQCAVVGWRTDNFNFASQRAIEKLGAKRDGVIRHHAARRNATVRDTVMYSMLASEWPAAKEKLEARLTSGGFEPSTSAAKAKTVRLVEVDSKNLVTLHRMNAGAIGSQMVAPNAMSVAQSFFSPNAWLRAIYADDTPVGLIMLFDPSLDEANAVKEEVALDTLYVWRLMIDFKHQGKGYGEAALRLIIERARSMPNVTNVTLSYVMEEGSAKPFYEKLGFRDTGKIDGEEMEMRLLL
jgi:N-acetyltransferase